jgi:hypothetical protein
LTSGLLPQFDVVVGAPQVVVVDVSWESPQVEVIAACPSCLLDQALPSPTEALSDSSGVAATSTQLAAGEDSPGLLLEGERCPFAPE